MNASRRHPRRATLSLVAMFGALCGAPQPSHAQESPVKPEVDAQTRSAETDAAAQDVRNRAFAFALYQAARQESDDNLFLSPYSVTACLGMTFAGARGGTEQQMSEALHFKLPQARLHPALHALDAALRADATAYESNTGGEHGPRTPPPILRTANRLWGQIGEKFLPEFLQLVQANYGGALEQINFGDAEAAAAAINEWVSAQTEKKIPELLTPNDVRNASLVLTNAVYFKAAWFEAFAKEATVPADFTRLNNSTVSVQMMNQQAHFGYAQRGGYQALRLRYAGGTWSMIVLVPDAGKFAECERALTATEFDAAVAALTPHLVRLGLPRFESRSHLKLRTALTQLGMTDAFSPAADFSGIDGKRSLFISEVIHEAFVKVDEDGTEAAAATAVIMPRGAAPEGPPISLTIDRPFLFVIFDERTKTALFIGRVVDPTAK